MPEVFVAKRTAPQPGFNLGVVMGNRIFPQGQVGIEIEVEGKNLVYNSPSNPKIAPWYYKEDGSLRGEESGEYVLKDPIMFDDVPKALETLWDGFAKRKTTFDDSNRTSVHVHLNCQSFHLNRLTSFMALYYIFEEILTDWCGDTRVGNLFCLRAKDAPAIISKLKDFIRADGKAALSDGLHYSGLNAQALAKFGSLEFRSLRGCSDPSVINDWVKILRRLYDLSASYRDPREVCAGFSGAGPQAFFNDILGPVAGIVRAGTQFTDNDIRESLYEGIRLAQDLCYCRDWSQFIEMDLRDDPFGRDKRKVSKKLIDSVSNGAMAVSDGPSPPLSNAYSFYEQYLATTPVQEPAAGLAPPVYLEESYDEPDYYEGEE